MLVRKEKGRKFATAFRKKKANEFRSSLTY
jgi:hypothetical protein